MWWHMSAAELECGVIDETGEYVGSEIDCVVYEFDSDRRENKTYQPSFTDC